MPARLQDPPTPKQAEAERLHAQGLSYRDIANAVGVGHSTVARWLKRDGARDRVVQERRRVIASLDDLMPLALKALEDGLSEDEDTKQRVVTAGIILTNKARLKQAGASDADPSKAQALYCDVCESDVFAQPCSHVLEEALEAARAREAATRH